MGKSWQTVLESVVGSLKQASPKWVGSTGFLLVKCLVLAAADFLSVWLAFTVSPVFHLENFPWAMLNLLVVLVVTDTVVLLYPTVKRRYGWGYALHWAVVTGGYYLLTLLLTALVYGRVRLLIFMVCAAAALLLYAGCAAAIILTRRRRRSGRGASVNGAAIAVSMLELGNRVHELQPLLKPRQWEGLGKAYASLRTCWEFAAPFGRSAQPVAKEMEAEIARRVETACGSMRELAGDVSEDGVQKAVRELLDITEQLKSREKLLWS